MNSFKRFKLTLTATLPLFVVATPAWAGSLRSPDRGVDSATLLEDSQYMRVVHKQKFKASSQDAVAIDLADPKQYRFVMNRLRGAGKTAENSPRLFERLAQARARALSGKAATPSGNDSMTMATANWGCDHFIALKGAATSGSYRTFDGNPWAACANGASYVYTDVVAYNSNQAGTDSTIVDSAAGEEYAAGQSFADVVVHPSLPIDFNRKVVLDSMMLAMNEATGAEEMTFVTVESTSLLALPNITVEHPRRAVSTSTSRTSSLCQQRGGLDCDYAVVKANRVDPQPWPYIPSGVALRDTTVTSVWKGDVSNYFPITGTWDWERIYVPTKFTYTAGSILGVECTISSILDGTRVRLVKPVTGGTCVSSASLVTALSGAVGRKTAAYNNLVDLSHETAPGSTNGKENCTPVLIKNQDVQYVMSVSTMLKCGSAPAVPSTVTVNMLTDSRYRFGLMVWNSCMAEGTQVVRADGTLLPVEQAKVGDKVMANDTGVVMTVTDVSVGGESQPMVIIKDNLGHEVSLTSMHPVILASGEPRAAGKLVVGDRVSTRNGVATLTSVSRRPYTGKVYNLTLGTPEELRKAGKNAHLMFANGFKVGDNTMQGELSAPVADTRPILARLAPSWHRDFQSAPSFTAGQR